MTEVLRGIATRYAVTVLSRVLAAHAFCLAVVAGCGGRFIGTDPTPSSGSGGSSGGAAESSGGTGDTAADGGGVCCAVASDPCTACDTGAMGGWAASSAQCNRSSGCNGLQSIIEGPHGCLQIQTGELPGASCCGCH